MSTLKEKIQASVFENNEYSGIKWRSIENRALQEEINQTPIEGFEKFNEKVWAILNDVYKLPRCYCGNTLRFLNVKKGFTKTCSFTCSRTSPEWKASVAATNIERYGSANVFASSEIKQKIKHTVSNRYGVEHSSQASETKEKTKNIKRKTYINKFLKLRFSELANLGIEPVGWTLDDYLDASIVYNFLHLECGKHYSGQFSSNGIPICPHCKSSGRSSIEQKLANDLEIIFPQIIRNDRQIIKPKEIDILIDAIGIEINGVYWHQADKSTDLLEKTTASPIQLLHFWDFELTSKYDICLSIIKAKLNHFDKKIMARKCKIQQVSNEAASTFFNSNHLQGQSNAGYYLGLYFEDELVQCISIGKSRFNKSVDIEIHRIATLLNTSVIGGINKLFAQVKRDFPGQRCITYADKRISTGDLYKRLGFTELTDSKPNYFWVKGQTIFARYATQKHKLPTLLGNKFNSEYSEAQNMSNAGYMKIKDCGNKVFITEF